MPGKKGWSASNYKKIFSYSRCTYKFADKRRCTRAKGHRGKHARDYS